MSASRATLGFDATTLSGVHVNAVHFATPDNILSAGIAEVPGARAEDYHKHIISVLNQLARVHSLWLKRDTATVKKELFDKVTSTICDRVKTNHSAVALLNTSLDKNLIEFNCNVHPLDSFSTASRDTLKSFNADVPSQSFGKDCRAANTIINLSKLRYKGNGDPTGFKLFLEKNGLSLTYFPRYVGNRFHVLFHTAGLIYHQRDKLVDYLTNSCNNGTTLRTATLGDLQSPDILTQLQALGMLIFSL